MILSMQRKYSYLITYSKICQIYWNKGINGNITNINKPKKLKLPFLFFFLRFYLFIHERHPERGRDIGRGRSRLPTGSPMRDSIPGPQDHDLSQRQMLNHWATQVPQSFPFPWPVYLASFHCSLCPIGKHSFWILTLSFYAFLYIFTSYV